MRNIIINFVASKYEKNGKYGDYTLIPQHFDLTLFIST